MKTTLSAIALAAALAQPATAVTFPSLTTIYVGTGVEDSGTIINTGTATVFQCSNVSGVSAQVRILILQLNGTVAGQKTATLAHGANLGLSTHATAYWWEDDEISVGVAINQGR